MTVFRFFLNNNICVSMKHPPASSGSTNVVMKGILIVSVGIAKPGEARQILIPVVQKVDVE